MIVDKTAQFVALNGREFEKKVMANESSNLKFQFLFENNPYHAYYTYKVAEFIHEKGWCEYMCGE